MSVNCMYRSDLWRPQPDDASVGVFDDVRKGAIPRIKHLLVLLRLFPGLAVAELGMAKPRTLGHIDKGLRPVSYGGRDHPSVIVWHFSGLRFGWNYENRLGAAQRLK